MTFMKHFADHVFMQKTGLSSFLFLLIHFAFAQDIPLETWRTHFSYRQVNHMVQASDRIFCAVDNALFYYDLNDNSIRKLTKLNGLSDVDITALAYSEEQDLLVIGYYSGGVDLITTDDIISVDDFRNTNLVEDKTIRDIQFWNEDILVATSLGIIVISNRNYEITENFRSIGLNGTDVSVNHLFVKGDSLFAITNQGIQVGNLDDNLLDFNNWYFFSETQSQINKHLGTYNDQLFSIKNDTVLLSLTNGQWEEMGIIFTDPVVSLKASSELLIATANAIYASDGSLAETAADPRGQPINDFVFNGQFWLGTETGLIPPFQTIEEIVPDGPMSDQSTNIVFENGKIYLFYGPSPENFTGGTDLLGYDTFDGEHYHYQLIDGFYNLSDVAHYSGKTYFSSVGSGIFIEEDDQILDHTNSSLSNSKNAIGPIITDLEVVTDKLWMSSYDNENPIVSIDDGGLIENYSESLPGTDSPLALRSSENGLLFIKNSLSAGGGVIAFDPDGTGLRLSTSNGLPSNEVNSVVVDLEDVCWIGTSEGLITYPDASFLLEFTQAVQPAFDNTLLFEDDEITALAYDGGNRIWISTSSGLWVINASLTEIDHHFTTENSPLPSNNINKMAYDDRSGEMYIQTEKGLVSFRSSSSAEKDNYDEVSIFPNPVRPGYSGLVGITGLRYDTFVKITNINGKLVRELETNGGTASWDLLDYNQQKVSSGVYVVFTSTTDGEERFIGKIAVIN